jgi:pyruvate kinase
MLAVAQNRVIRRTKIVATLGPATRDEAVLRGVIEAGADVLRLNFSHGDHATHARQIRLARRLANDAGRAVAILQDLQGPKIRVGAFARGKVELHEGAGFVITTRNVRGTGERVSTTYARLPRDVRPGDAILLHDGLLELRVEGRSRFEVRCSVVRGGTLRSNDGLNLPGVRISAPALTTKDREDLRFGLEQGVDLVALSFVRQARDVQAVRRLMARAKVNVPVLAKIEKPEALDDLDGILQAFDGVMVARGDLGVELAPEKVPVAQKRIIERANWFGKPVITATEMLESMTRSPRPTRAEASDVANAVLDGTDAVMLSGETAVGAYPVATVRAMDRIVREAETLPPKPSADPARRTTRAYAVCHAAVTLAIETDADALAAFTRSGRTARTLSMLRPGVPIAALCETASMARQLALWRGVVPVVTGRTSRAEDVTALIAEQLARRLPWSGRRVVVVGAARGQPPRGTNFVRLLRL